MQPDKIAEFLYDFSEATRGSDIRLPISRRRLRVCLWSWQPSARMAHYEVSISKRAFHALAEYRADQDIKATYGEEA